MTYREDEGLSPMQLFQEMYAYWRTEVGTEIIEYVHENMLGGSYAPAKLKKAMANFAGIHNTAQQAMETLAVNGCTLQDNVRVLELEDSGKFAVWLPRPPRPSRSIIMNASDVTRAVAEIHRKDKENRAASQPAATLDVYVNTAGAQSTPATQEHTMTTKAKATKTETKAPATETKAKAKAPKAKKLVATGDAAPKETIARTGFDGTYTLANGIMPEDVLKVVVDEVLQGKKSASGLRRVARKYLGLYGTKEQAIVAAEEAGSRLTTESFMYLTVGGNVAVFKPLSPKALAGITTPKAATGKPKAKAAKAAKA